MTFRDIAVRPMRHADIEDGLRLCRSSGWDQVARDWAMFLDGDGFGAIVAVQDDRIVATAATIRYGQSFGWIGMVLVDPSAQGRGLGATMLKSAMERIADLPSIRLDATPAGRPLYAKVGFLEERGLRRLEAATVRLTGDSIDSVRPMTVADLADVCVLDRIAFGAPRVQVIHWMLQGAPEYAHVTRVNGRLTGYVLGRRGHRFDHVGPLVADNVETGQALARACFARRAEREYVIDASAHSDEWSRFLENIGFHEQRPFIRMYRGGELPFGDPKRQLAVLGPEFG